MSAPDPTADANRPITALSEGARYRKLPVNPCPLRVLHGHAAIARAILERVRHAPRPLVVCDGFVGAQWDAWRKGLTPALAALGQNPVWIDVNEALNDCDPRREAIVQFHLTDDPVFGRICRGDIAGWFDSDKLRLLAERVDAMRGLVILYGAGASLVQGAGDCLLYVDVSKEVFQERCRKRATTNFACRESFAFGEMYKRAFYIDWPVLNREKRRLLPHLDFVVDESDPDTPKAIAGEGFRAALEHISRAPVRVKPFFLPGPWGGQWMKEHFALPPQAPNFAWSYELIAPENGILLGSETEWLEVSFDYLLWQEADSLMGRRVTNLFGGLFPIRFDYLDTMQGGNLSCQVHPRVDYIREEFGEPFTQHESYYVMQAEPSARVYLGLCEDTDPASFRRAAEQADRDGRRFEIGAYVNSFPSARHDLFLIPAGTVHCSGSGNLVLEISATPYIYTFKIYDYLRKDLNGELRHVSVERAFANIDFSRRTQWVARHLKPTPRLLRGDDAAAEYVIGDSELLFFAIHRLEFAREISDAANGRFLVLNLVEGERAEIQSAGRTAEIRYGETVIIPACIGEYRLINCSSAPLKVVKAFVR